MTNESIRHFLLWCTVINYGILVVWFLVFVFAHEAMHRVHSRWFQLSRDQSWSAPSSWSACAA
jgi:hypothetical protein